MKKKFKPKQLFLYFISMLSLSLVLLSCVDKGKGSSPLIDEEYNGYFHLNETGFTGGDGTYSVELPDGRTVWIFGDTFVGAVNEDNTRTKTDPIYIRNCFMVQHENNFEFLYNDTSEINRSLVIPPQVIESGFDTSEYEQWYWPGDGFVHDADLNLFVSEFHQVDTGMWGFNWEGTALVTFSLPDLTQRTIREIPYGLENGVHYGHALCELGDSLYIYGLKDGKAHVAKAAIYGLDEDWVFYNGESWSADPKESAPMSEIDGSEQFSVFERNGSFYYLTQMGSLSPEICIYKSDLPYKGWTEKRSIYSTPLDSLNTNIFTYNALAHPHLENEDGMLISYNTNSFKLEDHYDDAGIYRPRFVRIDLSGYYD